MEKQAFLIMKKLLCDYGLQTTLKTFCDALDELIHERGPSIESCLILETIKGVYQGYLRRYDEEDHKNHD